ERHRAGEGAQVVDDAAGVGNGSARLHVENEVGTEVHRLAFKVEARGAPITVRETALELVQLAARSAQQPRTARQREYLPATPAGLWSDSGRSVILRPGIVSPRAGCPHPTPRARGPRS